MSKKKIAICSSASFYPQVIDFCEELETLGLEVVLPKTAANMRANKTKNIEAITDWANSAIGYHGKALLIREHFDEISRCDAVLVMNYEKHGKPNYIGPNVLMEMSIAFYLSKPIYVLNDQPDDSPLIDEILGLEPIFLKGEISRIER